MKGAKIRAAREKFLIRFNRFLKSSIHIEKWSSKCTKREGNFWVCTATANVGYTGLGIPRSVSILARRSSSFLLGSGVAASPFSWPLCVCVCAHEPLRWIRPIGFAREKAQKGTATSRTDPMSVRECVDRQANERLSFPNSIRSIFDYYFPSL